VRRLVESISIEAGISRSGVGTCLIMTGITATDALHSKNRGRLCQANFKLLHSCVLYLSRIVIGTIVVTCGDGLVGILIVCSAVCMCDIRNFIPMESIQNSMDMCMSRVASHLE